MTCDVLAVSEHAPLAGDRFERGTLAGVEFPDRGVGRVLREQPAVAVEQRDAVGAGEAAQERCGGLGGLGVEAMAKGAAPPARRSRTTPSPPSSASGWSRFAASG